CPPPGRATWSERPAGGARPRPSPGGSWRLLPVRRPLVPHGEGRDRNLRPQAERLLVGGDLVADAAVAEGEPFGEPFESVATAVGEPPAAAVRTVVGDFHDHLAVDGP